MASVVGTSGSDTFNESATANDIDGLGGVDTVNYSSSTSAVSVTLTNHFGSGTSGFAAGDTYSNIEKIIGSDYNDTLASSTYFTGGFPYDTHDRLAGGLGNDTYVLDLSYGTLNGAIIEEAANEGTDQVLVSASSYTLTANVEILTYTGTSNFGGTGNSSDNVITGGIGNDVLDGAAGADTINAGDGNDVLIGGGGADTLNGGAGVDLASYSTAGAAVIINLVSGIHTNDAYGDIYSSIAGFVGSNYSDTFIDASGAYSYNGGGGVDVVSYANSTSAVSVTLTNHSGSGTSGFADGDTYSNIEKIIGSNYDDTIASATYFTGGFPYDTYDRLAGGLGNDTYVLDLSFGTLNGAIVEEAENEGTDQILVSAYSYTMTANVENMTYTGASSFGGTGNSSDNIITGGIGNDVLDGAGGADTLNGGDGNDLLTGGVGADILNGGAGSDTVSYSTAGSAVTINLVTGTHTGDAAGDIYSSIEGVTGSNYSDSFVASGDANSFNGLGGLDTVSYASSTSAVSVTLANHSGSATGGYAEGDTYLNIEKVIGSSYDDTFVSWTYFSGGYPYDTMDRLAGGLGDDTYVIHSNGILVEENVGSGTDLVQAWTGYALTDNVENLTYMGSSAFGGTGNALDNIITGGIGNDVLDGAGGADTLNGGDGNDLLTGGVGADILNGGAGSDTVSYSTAGSAVTINLVTGTHTGDAAGDIYSSIEGVTGSNYSDSFVASGDANSFNGLGGLDTVSYASSTSAVSVTLANHSGSATGGYAEGDTYLNIEKVIGSSYDDTFVSWTYFSGGYPYDTMDRLAGGLGDDTYVIHSNGILVEENVGSGTDLVQAWTGYALTDNVENLTYMGSSAFGGTGNALDNIITGGIGNDVLDGAGGADTLNGGDGSDTLTGGDGNDTLNAGDGNDVLNGGVGADALDGGAGTDTASYAGAASAVAINLVTGIHTGEASGDMYTSIEGIVGSNYADTFVASVNAHSFNGMGGIDTVSYASSTSAVSVALSNHYGSGTGGYAEGDAYANIEKIIGSNFDDTLSSSTYFSGGYPYDTQDRLAGGLGNDTYVVGTSNGVIVEEDASSGIDLVLASVNYILTANVENLTYTGTNAFAGTGNAIANVITGGVGDDVLLGAAGADTLIGGGGIDTASYSGSSAGVVVNLATGAGVGGDAQGDVLSGIENLLGSSFADTLTGNSGANVLNGDIGNDILAGGAGADSLLGGGGTDTASYSSSAAGVSVNLTTGTGTGGDAQGDTLSQIEAVIGSAFADTLTSSVSGHQLEGGTGNDTYVIGATGIALIEATGAGTDLVQTSLISYTLGANLDNLTHTGSLNFSGDGNALNNVITSGAGSDTLNGFDGNDTLIGNGGADALDGGNGSDTAVYSGSNAAVQVDLLAGTAVGGHATGDVLTSIENLTGSAYADTLTGTNGVNRLDGGLGADTLYGLAGDDTLIGGAGADLIYGGDGVDTASYITANQSIVFDLADSIITGDAAGDVYDSIEIFEATNFNDFLRGDAGNNSLKGAGGSDQIEGGAGADTLDGGSGTDSVSFAGSASAVNVNFQTGVHTGGDAQDDILISFESIIGSAYDDTFTAALSGTSMEGGAGADTLIGGSGIDTASYASSGVAVTIDLVSGTASGGDAYGDTFSSIERFIGSAGDDLFVASSAITVSGGLGNDTYIVGHSGMVVSEGAGGGTDTVETALSSYTLSANVENLNYTGAVAATLRGNVGANVITAGDANDILIGGGGADTLNGGDGIDTASYATASSAISINLSTGLHTGDATGDSFDGIEVFTGSDFNDILIGNTGADVFNGGAGNDALTGNSGDDNLNGGEGIDTLQSGVGADFLNGGLGSDRFIFENSSDSSIPDGLDLIEDFSQFEGDLIDLQGIEGLNFIGNAAFSASAGELRFELSSTQTIVTADIDGDGYADFELHLTGNITLSSSDLLL